MRATLSHAWRRPARRSCARLAPAPGGHRARVGPRSSPGPGDTPKPSPRPTAAPALASPGSRRLEELGEGHPAQLGAAVSRSRRSARVTSPDSRSSATKPSRQRRLYSARNSSGDIEPRVSQARRRHKDGGRDGARGARDQGDNAQSDAHCTLDASGSPSRRGFTSLLRLVTGWVGSKQVCARGVNVNLDPY